MKEQTLIQNFVRKLLAGILCLKLTKRFSLQLLHILLHFGVKVRATFIITACDASNEHI